MRQLGEDLGHLAHAVAAVDVRTLRVDADADGLPDVAAHVAAHSSLVAWVVRGDLQ